MDPPTTPTEQRPIGFWLKLVDRLIDERFDRVPSAHGITRRHWQVLNLLEQGGGSVVDIDGQLRPFLDDGEPTTQPVIADLVRRGWASVNDDRVSLTAAGRDLRGTLSTEVSDVRRNLVAGITPEEYTLTLSVLERMARNLGWAQSDQEGK